LCCGFSGRWHLWATVLDSSSSVPNPCISWKLWVSLSTLHNVTVAQSMWQEHERQNIRSPLISMTSQMRNRHGLEHSNSGKKVSIRFDSILATESIFSIRFDSPIWQICRLYTDIQVEMMMSLVKGLAASLYAVVHSVPYQYQLDNFQPVRNV